MDGMGDMIGVGSRRPLDMPESMTSLDRASRAADRAFRGAVGQLFAHLGESTPPTFDVDDVDPRQWTIFAGDSQHLPGTGHGDWMVIGDASPGQLQLARSGPHGLERTTRPWRELVAADSGLFNERMVTLDGTSYRLLSSPEDAGRGRVQLLDMATNAEREVEWSTIAPTMSELTPVVRRPGPQGMTDILELVRPRLAVMDAVNGATAGSGHSMLVGTSSTGIPAYDPQVRRVERIAAWFDRVAGIDVLSKERPLTLNINVPSAIGNAFGGVVQGQASLYLGPHEPVARGILTHWGRQSRDEIVGVRLLARRPDAILAHELGHVAHMHEWGARFSLYHVDLAGDDSRLAPIVAGMPEHDVVQESVGDLFGAAYARTTSLGVRRLGALTHDIHDLPGLRSHMAVNGVFHDAHMGTQLLTKPMLHIARTHGWDAMGEINGAAVRAIGIGLPERAVPLVSIPMMADALRNAAAMRWGLDDVGVKALERGFRMVQVL